MHIRTSIRIPTIIIIRQYSIQFGPTSVFSRWKAPDSTFSQVWMRQASVSKRWWWWLSLIYSVYFFTFLSSVSLLFFFGDLSVCTVLLIRDICINPEDLYDREIWKFILLILLLLLLLFLLIGRFLSLPLIVNEHVRVWPTSPKSFVCVCVCVSLFRKSNCSNVALVFALFLDCFLAVALSLSLSYLHVSVSFEPNLFSCLSASLGVCSWFLSLLGFFLSFGSVISIKYLLVCRKIVHTHRASIWLVAIHILLRLILFLDALFSPCLSPMVQVKKQHSSQVRKKPICTVYVRV